MRPGWAPCASGQRESTDKQRNETCNASVHDHPLPRPPSLGLSTTVGQRTEVWQLLQIAVEATLGREENSLSNEQPSPITSTRYGQVLKNAWGRLYLGYRVKKQVRSAR
jgi:hypothetical protein